MDFKKKIVKFSMFKEKNYNLKIFEFFLFLKFFFSICIYL